MTHKDFDLHTFTAAVCAELGGVNESSNDHALTRFTILDGAVALVMRTGYGSTANKVTISAFLPFEDVLDYYQRTKIDSITVTGTRPAVDVAKDIRRKLLADIESKIVDGRAKVNEHNARKSDMGELVARWEKAFPGLSVKPASNGQSASVYFNKDGAYLSGDVRPTGELAIQRLSLNSPEQAVALLALLSGKTLARMRGELDV